ncbi:MAG: tRNA pseudouridine(38-40) synthase TruA [Clostridiales bacterium]|nr:tRNA pseudouridine(38-40) synthase TruA [Clostridiales bacterium]
MEKKNVFLKIEYDGTNFYGWQRQPRMRTVQGELEQVLSVVCNTDIKINGTSRTDAGVHALGQQASFEAEFGIPVERIPLAANNLLAGGKMAGCGDVRIISAEVVPEGFHARFDAKGKQYIYKIRCADEPDIFLKNYRYQMTEHLDVSVMREAAKYIVGTHDFKCFQASGGEEKETTVRTVYDLEIIETVTDAVKEMPSGAADRRRRIVQDIEIRISGDGFLYNMVRIITGTLVEVGLGKKKPEDIPAVIESLDRQNAGHTAPPQGLYLAEVYYDRV